MYNPEVGDIVRYDDYFSVRHKEECKIVKRHIASDIFDIIFQDGTKYTVHISDMIFVRRPNKMVGFKYSKGMVFEI